MHKAEQCGSLAEWSGSLAEQSGGLAERQRQRSFVERQSFWVFLLQLHPVAFASKHTSTIEEQYQPYILKFVALKYSLDKFSDITWGFPIKLETDC